jgi:hypothetical protein
MSVSRAMREIDSAEFTEWLAYYEIEPFGECFTDLRTGLITSAIYNVNRNVKAHPEAFGALHFIPWAAQRNAANEDAQPVLLPDKNAQSNLISAALFGVVLDGKKTV